MQMVNKIYNKETFLLEKMSIKVDSGNISLMIWCETQEVICSYILISKVRFSNQ